MTIALRVVLSIAFLIAVSSAGGCGQRVTMSSWQQSLQQYTEAQHRGDLSFLRDPPPGATARQFRVMSSDLIDESTDVTGVLVGRAALNNRPWLIFMVGVSRRGALADLRLALLSDDAAPPTWLFSEEDDAALEAYQRPSRAGQDAAPNQASAAKPALGFPAEGDRFDAETSGSLVTVREERTGARWQLNSAAKQKDDLAETSLSNVRLAVIHPPFEHERGQADPKGPGPERRVG